MMICIFLAVLIDMLYVRPNWIRQYIRGFILVL
jgi:hypothetical protein